jgi:2'-deoxynucleoside 5'-phosphate N-hydrolase
VIAEELFSHVKTLYTKPPLNFYVGIAIAGSDRSNLECGQEIGRVVQKHGTILDDHVLSPDVIQIEARNIAKGVNISKRDMTWVGKSHYMVVEGSIKGIGMGMEIQKALDDMTPVLFLHRLDKRTSLTNMIIHRALYDPNLIVRPYERKDQLEGIIDRFVEEHKFWID